MMVMERPRTALAVLFGLLSCVRAFQPISNYQNRGMTTTSSTLFVSPTTTPCPEPEYQAVAGVDRCLVGYSGGIEPNPTYQSIQDYTEALLIEYDPSRVSYQEILKTWRMQSTPYPSKRQYRSAIFYLNEEQKQIAEEFCKEEKYVDIEPVTKFYMAEEYHQNYLKKMMTTHKAIFY